MIWFVTASIVAIYLAYIAGVGDGYYKAHTEIRESGENKADYRVGKEIVNKTGSISTDIDEYQGKVVYERKAEYKFDEDWTPDQDIILAEIVLRHIREGGLQSEAFKEASDKLNKLHLDCSYRWKKTVQHTFKSAIDLAQRQRAGRLFK